MSHSRLIAEQLLAIGAVRLSPADPFTWTSGIRSPIYCDNRMLYSHPTARDIVVDALVRCIKNLHKKPDVIAGTATAAIGWAALVADRLHLPFVYVRAKPKEHGAKKMIEGDLQKEKNVVVVEDLISTAKSSATTVESLRAEGLCIVTDVVSIFSYELAQSLATSQALSVLLHPLCTMNTLLDVAVEQKILTTEQATIVRDFSHDPEGWAKKHVTTAR